MPVTTASPWCEGPYGGEQCAATTHSHHRNVLDSVYQQTRLQSQFYQKMRELNVYVNQVQCVPFPLEYNVSTTIELSLASMHAARRLLFPGRLANGDGCVFP